jgi:UDP-N-acetylmuramoyl-tripeptide--D-alanyl-D-alanine ligase
MLKAHVMRRAMDVRAKHPNLTVIGITGSVGKTTTKELLVHVLGPACIAFTPAYVNSDMGVAQWLTRTLRDIPEESSGVVVVEMGAYRSGEIALLCQIAKPTMGILTAIGDQHLALFGSLENLRAAKAELIEALPAEGQAFVNGDMQVCREVALRAKCPVTIVGTTEKTNLRATNVTETPEGLRMVIGAQRCDVPLHGLHNATNVLLAVAAAVQTGVPFKMVTDRLRSFRPPTHTFSVRMDGGITILDDTHNASTLSARAAIAWAKERPAKRRILIMNELIELGPTSQRAHVEIGTLASVVFDDVVILQKRAATWFSQGFGRPTHVSLTAVLPLAPDTLIVCIGRIPAYILRALHS